MHLDDTIVAISSAAGHGRRGIIRLSGPAAWELALTLLSPRPTDLLPRRWIDADLAWERIGIGLLLFRTPASFTGQDMAELHVPGIPVLLQRLTAELRRCGARSAAPGEFSYRACELGKIDISRAEGINAVIHAQSEQEFSAASALRCGELYRWTERQSAELAELLALVEAGIDFTDEHDVGAVTADEYSRRIDALRWHLEELQIHSRRWHPTDHQPLVVLAGAPNAGKSSLFNALLGHQRAIVSPVAGTTRDSLAAPLRTPSGVVTLVDSAGYEDDSTHLRASMNQMRAGTMQRADVVILVSETGDDFPPAASEPQIICVKSKADISDGSAGLAVSSVTGVGMGELLSRIGHCAFGKPAAVASRIFLNQRHMSELELADSALARAADTPHRVETEPELVAADLRAALDSIGRITGTISSDDILGLIFGRFCVGK